MSRSNATEIIAILWLIAALLCTGFWHWLFVALAVENTLESMYKSLKDHERTMEI